MGEMDITETFRALLDAAVRFERKAANEKRVGPEREALREAITRAQLILSVQDKPDDQEGPKQPIQSRLQILAGVKGGKIDLPPKRLKTRNRRRRP